MDDSVDSKEKIFAEYKVKANKIVRDMLNVLIRAHRKVDDLEYRKVLEKLNQT